MENADVVQLLREIADILEITGENAYRVRAYRQAAQAIDTLPGPIADLWRTGALTSIPGVGARLAATIGEYLETGRCGEHDKVASGVPAGVLDLLRIEGIGPKTAASLWKGLGVTSLDALEQCCRDGRLLELPRMGPQRARSILDAIARHRARSGRMPLHRALGYADAIVSTLRQVPGVERVEAAGSLRRRRETVGDLDILVIAPNAEPVTRALTQLREVASAQAEGPTKSVVRLKIGLQVDVRVLPRESFGAAMHYFTGSKAHNIALRTRAVHRGLKISEYGVFDREGRRLSGENEEDVFRAVGLPWIPPELREGTGELEAAEQGTLPHLVDESDVLGDLHVHSDASADCRSTLEEMAYEARRLGMRYLAITDHSQSRPLGLTPEGLAKHVERIRGLDRRLGGAPRLLAGIEVDIKADGSLDLPLDVLRELDWVVASIHSHFHDGPDALTERLERALRTGVVDVIGHPTGRILGARDPYSIDLPRVLAAAAEVGAAMEVNAQPERLDLTDRACRLAREFGVPVAINTDAHITGHLSNMRYGVWVARRGWLEASSVVNTALEPRRRRSQGHHAEAAP